MALEHIIDQVEIFNIMDNGKMVCIMEKEKAIIKTVQHMMDNLKTIKRMALGHFIDQVEILNIMDNGKIICFMDKVLGIIKILKIIKNLIILILLSLRICGLNMKEILKIMNGMELELFI